MRISDWSSDVCSSDLGEGHRQAGLAAELAHPVELVPLAIEVARHFEHSMADAAHCAADLDPFPGGRGGARHAFAVVRLVDPCPAGRKAERAGAPPFLAIGRESFWESVCQYV